MEPLRNSSETFEGKRGFSIWEMPLGTKVSIHTRNSVYDFVVLENHRVSVFGGAKEGETRIAKPTRAFVAGSRLADGQFRPGWIGEGMRLKFQTEEKGQENKLYLTSRVRDASIESKDGDWHYTMNWRE